MAAPAHIGIIGGSGLYQIDGLAEVTEHLGPAGCYAFAEAVSVLETFQRACLTLGIQEVPA